jgi:general secretion pathway protein K
VALILALIVLALLIILLAQMSVTSLHNRTVAENHLAEIQNAYGCRSGYHEALLYLKTDLEKAPNMDSIHERWASGIEITAGTATVHVDTHDSTRFINLSRLVNEKGEEDPVTAGRLRRLVAVLRHPPDVADRIIDYVDADTKGSFELRARNERLFNLEELQRVEGIPHDALYGGRIGNEVRKGILPFLTVWPRDLPQGMAAGAGGININTASAEVLASLSDKMTIQLGEEIVSYRDQPSEDGKTPYREFGSPEDLKKVAGMTDDIFLSIQSSVVVRSEFFEIKVKSSVGNADKRWVYVVQRGTGAQGGLSLLSSQRLTDFVSVAPPPEEKP